MIENRLKELRVAKGLTQTDIAKYIVHGELADTSTKVMVSMIENGHVLPSVDVMRLLCKLLECKPTDLYDKGELDFCVNSYEKDDDDVLKIECGEDFKSLVESSASVVGYGSINDWFVDSARKLINEAKVLTMTRMLAVIFHTDKPTNV